jgi:hypothetical protein
VRARRLGALPSALDQCLVDDHLRSHTGEFTSLPCLYLLSIGSKLRCFRSTPTEIQSISEYDFECFSITGVNALGTMFPDSDAVASKAWV